jgi:hypothetical protein
MTLSDCADSVEEGVELRETRRPLDPVEPQVQTRVALRQKVRISSQFGRCRFKKFYPSRQSFSCASKHSEAFLYSSACNNSIPPTNSGAQAAHYLCPCARVKHNIRKLCKLLKPFSFRFFHFNADPRVRIPQTNVFDTCKCNIRNATLLKILLA